MSNFAPPDPEKGVFETLLVIGGVPIELDAHLERLASSVRELYAAEPPAKVRALVLEHAAPVGLGRLRLTLVPARAADLRADVVTASVDPESVFPPFERGASLASFVIEGSLGAHKWADRASLEALEASGPAGTVALLVDAGGNVLEASRANVYAVEGDLVVTPPADGRVLPGVARANAIEVAGALGIEVREEPLALARLKAAGEAFLTGSVRGLEPVRSVDGVELAPPGAAAVELASEMKRRWFEQSGRSAAPISRAAP